MDMSPVKGSTSTPVLRKESEELVKVLQKLPPAEMKRRSERSMLSVKAMMFLHDEISCKESRIYI